MPHEQRRYPFYCCYDFESILSQDDLPENGEKLSFTSKHISLSVVISSKIPKFEDLICFVSEGIETVLVQKWWIIWKKSQMLRTQSCRNNINMCLMLLLSVPIVVAKMF